MVASQQNRAEQDWLYDNEWALWVRKGYLIDTIAIDQNTVETGTSKFKRGLSKSWRYEMKAGTLWVAYEDMPPQQRQRIEDILKHTYKGIATDVYGIATEAIFKNRFITQADPTDDARYFMTLQVKAGQRAFSQAEAEDMATGLKILRGLTEYLDSTDYAKGVTLGKTKVVKTAEKFIEWFSQVLKTWRIKSLNVGHPRVMRRRLKDFKEQGRDCIIPEKVGNQNAQKVTAEMITDMLVLSGCANKPTDKDVADEVNSRYNLSLSNATISNYLRKPENERKVLAVREGKIHAMKKTSLHIAQARLRYADEMWFVDTTTVQLAVADESGKQIKIPMNRVSVFDGYSQKRVGVAYGVTETADLVWEAMYFAFKSTGRLPNVLKSDNGGANVRHDLVAKYKLLGITHITITPRRSTAQRDIEHDQHKHERMLQRIMPNFTGGNFMGRGQQMRFNPDNLKALQKKGELPNWLQTVAKDYEIFMSHNSMPNKKGKTPNELYGASVHEKRCVLTLPSLVQVFDPLSDNNYRMEHGQIQFEHNKQRYQYWVGTPMEADIEFFKCNEGNRFKIRFNPADPSVIGLFSERWEFISVAVRKHQFSQNPKALTDEERKAVLHNLAGDKALQAWGVEQYKALQADTESRGALTHIDWDTKLKEAVQMDTLSTMWEDVEHLGILNSERKRLQPKTQAHTNSIAPEEKANFFSDDNLAKSLLD
jgi:transposase InsO family protein